MKDKLAMVSRMVTADNKPILWIFRDEPEDKEDSGWRIFSGDEEEDYFDEEDNFDWLTVAELLEKEPTIEPFIKHNPNSEFERDSVEDAWVEVSDTL